MCFTLGWLLNLVVWLIVIGAVVAIFRIWVMPLLAALDSRIVATINILIYVAVAIFVIYLLVDVVSCIGFPGRGVLR